MDSAVGAHQRWLAERGLGRGDRISVLSWNRPEIVFLWFAAARRGASLVPLNARLTASELTPLIERTRASLVLADNTPGLRISMIFPAAANLSDVFPQMPPSAIPAET